MTAEAAVSPRTQRDNENAKYFHDGWNAALTELSLIDSYRGAADAVAWAKGQINEEGNK